MGERVDRKSLDDLDFWKSQGVSATTSGQMQKIPPNGRADILCTTSASLTIQTRAGANATFTPQTGQPLALDGRTFAGFQDNGSGGANFVFGIVPLDAVPTFPSSPGGAGGNLSTVLLTVGPGGVASGYNYATLSAFNTYNSQSGTSAAGLGNTVFISPLYSVSSDTIDAGSARYVFAPGRGAGVAVKTLTINNSLGQVQGLIIDGGYFNKIVVDASQSTTSNITDCWYYNMFVDNKLSLEGGLTFNTASGATGGYMQNQWYYGCHFEDAANDGTPFFAWTGVANSGTGGFTWDGGCSYLQTTSATNNVVFSVPTAITVQTVCRWAGAFSFEGNGTVTVLNVNAGSVGSTKTTLSEFIFTPGAYFEVHTAVIGLQVSLPGTTPPNVKLNVAFEQCIYSVNSGGYLQFANITNTSWAALSGNGLNSFTIHGGNMEGANPTAVALGIPGTITANYKYEIVDPTNQIGLGNYMPSGLVADGSATYLATPYSNATGAYQMAGLGAAGLTITPNGTNGAAPNNYAYNTAYVGGNVVYYSGSYYMALYFPVGSLAAYNAGTTYVINNQVTSGGIAYISLVNGNVGNTPASSPTDWAAISPPNTATSYWQVVTVGSASVRVRFDAEGAIATALNTGLIQLAWGYYSALGGGSGSAPAQAAAATGNVVGPVLTYRPAALNTVLVQGFEWVIPGIIPGATIWVDLQTKASSSSDAFSVGPVAVTIGERPTT